MVHPFAKVEQAPLRRLRKRLGQIRRFAKTPARLSKSHGDLHRFRVALKTWRAQLRLLRAIDPAFPYREVYRPFKQIFAQAGAIRFWQLQGQVLADTPQAPEAFGPAYRAFVQHRAAAAARRLRKAVAASDLPRWRDLKAELQSAARYGTPEAVQGYFETLRLQIRARCAGLGRRHREALHEIRKGLKEYANNRRFATRAWGFDPGPALPSGPDHTALDDLLGQWHDLDAACVQLARDLQRQTWEPAARKHGQELLRVWKKAERMLWDQVLAELPTAPKGSTQ